MVKFFNVRSGERVEATTEPMIAGYFNSSDLNPNGIVQDFGWRLHPSMVKRIKDLEEDEEFMDKLADKLQIPVENVATYHILKYIAEKDAREKAKDQEKETTQYQEQYERELAEALQGETAEEEEASTPKKSAPRGAKKPRVATPAEIEKQKELDDKKLAEMIAEDDNSK